MEMVIQERAVIYTRATKELTEQGLVEVGFVQGADNGHAVKGTVSWVQVPAPVVVALFGDISQKMMNLAADLAGNSVAGYETPGGLAHRKDALPNGDIVYGYPVRVSPDPEAN